MQLYGLWDIFKIYSRVYREVVDIAKEYAKKFYKSIAWKKCRDSYFHFRHGLCERCKETGKIVHHKDYITPKNIEDPEITLSFSNLELLCQDCHNREHHERNSPVVKGVMFDENGDLIRSECE